MRRHSIQRKIVLPFLLLFAPISIIVPLITVELFAWKYSEQFIKETQGWLNVIIETGFIREDPEKHKQAYSVEVMIFGSDFTLNASTLTELSDAEQNRDNLIEVLRLDNVRSSFQNSSESPITHDVTLGGKHYKVFYRICSIWENLLPTTSNGVNS